MGAKYTQRCVHQSNQDPNMDQESAERSGAAVAEIKVPMLNTEITKDNSKMIKFVSVILFCVMVVLWC